MWKKVKWAVINEGSVLGIGPFFGHDSFSEHLKLRLKNIHVSLQVEENFVKKKKKRAWIVLLNCKKG